MSHTANDTNEPVRQARHGQRQVLHQSETSVINKIIIFLIFNFY